MTPEEYRERGHKLWQSDGIGEFSETMVHALFGLQTEAAEVTDVHKKWWFTPERGPDPIEVEGLMLEELGDVLYYLDRIAEYYGITLQEIMEFNIQKLEKRYG